MSSKKTYSSLPSRPLSLAEADSLANDGRFAPLSVVSELPEWLDSEEWGIEDLEETTSAFVITLLHATDNYAIALGFSEPDEGWVKIGRWEAESYNQRAVEKAVQAWGRETYPEWKHGKMNIGDSSEDSTGAD